jgi:hypothetical protein
MWLIVDPRGAVWALYEEYLDWPELGPVAIRRASYVEPRGAVWYADLSPVGGPVLGPFARRSQALAAELEYLQETLQDPNLRRELFARLN